MSVNTSEEYLDELLQAIEPIIHMNDPILEPDMPEAVLEESVSEITTDLLDNPMEIPMPETVMEEMSMVQDDIPTIQDEIPLFQDESPQIQDEVPTLQMDEVIEDASVEETQAEDVTMDDLLAALTSEESAEIEEVSTPDLDIDAMLSAVENTNEAMQSEAFDSSAHDEDVKELLKQFTDDEDLTDINDILERHDNSEAIDETLLETPDVEVFQLEEDVQVDAEEGEQKKEKGIFSFLKKKREKKKDKKKRGKKAEEEARDVQDEVNVAELTSDVTESATAEVPEEAELLAGLEAGVLGSAPRGNVEVEATDSMDAAPELGVDALFGDADMSDIEQLLTGGSFDEIIPVKREKDEDTSSKKGNGKKESFFSRFINMLMEEDEEDEPKKGKVPEADATGVTDENIAILDELSKEEKKRAKKERKEQKKKEKEAKKNGKAAPAADGDEEELEVDNKKGKKEKKVKKPKVRKVQEIGDKPEKKLSRKKVSMVFVLCFSILAMILILQTVLWNLSNLKEARWAFDNADYETCYANLYGEKLSEEDQIIFEKSYIILSVQRKLDSYENFMRLDMELEAVNALFEGIRVYRDMEERASGLNILDRIYGTYQIIREKLYGYGLSDSDVEEILNYESNVTYTKRLSSLVNGTPFEVEEFPIDAEGPEVEEPQPLEDVLPQEEDFLPDDTSQVNEISLENAETVDTSTGSTVVVGSSPVDISGFSDADDIGGENVGNGNTNVSAPVNGDTVVVDGL